MIKIIVTKKAFEDKDIGYDSQFDLNCEINVSEDATYDEAMYAWFEALKVAGYSPDGVDKLMKKMEL